MFISASTITLTSYLVAKSGDKIRGKFDKSDELTTSAITG